MVINFKKIILVVAVFILTKAVILVSADDAAQLQLNRNLYTTFQLAEFMGNLEDWLNRIHNMINQGANPNWINQDGFYPKRETVIFQALRQFARQNNQQGKSFHRRAIKELLDAGASLNVRDIDGLTPLTLANQLGISEVLRQN